MDKIKLGYAFCGSFCTIKQSVAALRTLAKLDYSIMPIMSSISFFITYSSLLILHFLQPLTQYLLQNKSASCLNKATGTFYSFVIINGALLLSSCHCGYRYPV